MRELSVRAMGSAPVSSDVLPRAGSALFNGPSVPVYLSGAATPHCP
jgi:hypothetical protein